MIRKHDKRNTGKAKKIDRWLKQEYDLPVRNCRVSHFLKKDELELRFVQIQVCAEKYLYLLKIIWRKYYFKKYSEWKRPRLH